MERKQVNTAMDEIILNTIPLQIEQESLMKRLRIDAENRHAEDLGRLIKEAHALAKPRAMCRPVYIEAKGEDFIVLDGVTLKSRVLKVNVEEAHRVFPFVATCGMELDGWARSKEDILDRFWADSIKEIAVRMAVRFLNRHIKETYRLGRTSTMAPGSLSDWPIEEQSALFRLLGDTKTSVGVELAESLMMIPEHSVSGVIFPTEVLFESCQLCPRERCPGRRAPYDKDLFHRRYRKREE